MVKKIFRFFSHDLWNMPTKNKGRFFRASVHQLKAIILAIKGFTDHNVQLRASALTYFTLLSIVPILAMIFGIAKGFGFESYLQEALEDALREHKAILSEAIQFANNMLAGVKGGFIAGTGLIVLIWSVMKVLGNIEDAFNGIWQIKKSRGFSRKLSDYISIIVIAPILLFISSGFTISQTGNLFNDPFIISYIGPVIKFLVWLLSFSIIWFVFTLLYIIMPNTKVKFGPAFMGGVIAGTMFHLLQWAYVTFQVFLSKYGTIYGSFAALPLFLIWLQISWLIVLFGAEVSYASQNIDNYDSKSESINLSNYNKRLLSLFIMHHIIKNFTNARPPDTAADIASKLDIPVRLVRNIIYELQDVAVISETNSGNVKEPAFQPAMDPSNISVSYLVDKLDKAGNDRHYAADFKEVKRLSEILDVFYNELHKSPKNMLLKEL
jgi:membrane protein